MNLLTLSISPCEENVAREGVFFLVTASVDGMTLLDYLDVDEFFLSLSPLQETAFAKVTKTKPKAKKARAMASTVTKHLPIFNCSCGCFGCGGYYVGVTLTREGHVWESSFAYSSQGARRYVFSWDNVREVAGELIAAIAGAERQFSEGEVNSGATGVNLVDRLPFYRARYAALENVGVIQLPTLASI